MKIGILTWYFGINYGARAHSLALMKFLESEGHEVKFINYRKTKSFKKDLFNACQFENRHRHPIRMLKGLRKLNLFNRQLDDYPQSDVITEAFDIKIGEYDAIILGSDEILNIYHPLFSSIYYGKDISDRLPCMMYAPSAGIVQGDSEIPELLGDLQKVKYLSARDVNTKEWLMKNTENKRIIEEVLDPTFLYDFKEGNLDTGKDKYILLYSFGYLNDYSDHILKFARDKGLKVYAVGQISNWADKSFIDVNLYDWLKLYKNSEMIVTDSYHGFIFALKYHKDFVLIGKGDKLNKIDGLREYLKIERGYLRGGDSIDNYLGVSVDYSAIDERIAFMKEKSLRYLRDSLEGLSKLNGEKRI